MINDKQLRELEGKVCVFNIVFEQPLSRQKLESLLESLNNGKEPFSSFLGIASQVNKEEYIAHVLDISIPKEAERFVIQAWPDMLAVYFTNVYRQRIQEILSRLRTGIEQFLGMKVKIEEDS